MFNTPFEFWALKWALKRNILSKLIAKSLELGFQDVFFFSRSLVEYQWTAWRAYERWCALLVLQCACTCASRSSRRKTSETTFKMADHGNPRRRCILHMVTGLFTAALHFYWWDPRYMSKQSGFVFLFLFPRSERHLPIRDNVIRHVKEFVFIAQWSFVLRRVTVVDATWAWGLPALANPSPIS